MLNFDSIDDFYSNFKKLSVQQFTEYKINCLKSIIRSDTIYKFVQFDGDMELNEQKLSSLKHETLWFSHHRFLNDPTEYELKYDAKMISKITGISISAIEFAYGTLQDLYELCSFTYELNKYMWDTYSNKGNGICIEFDVGNYDMLYPVIYKDKDTLDFTKMIIKSLNNIKRKCFFDWFDPMSILPFIVKNPMNGKLDSRKEKEVRMLYAPTDKSEFNDGILYPNAKEELNFGGINVSFDELQLSVISVIIGENCRSEIQKQIEQLCKIKGYKLQYPVTIHYQY